MYCVWEGQVCTVCGRDRCVLCVGGTGVVCVCVESCVSERMFKLLRCVMGCPAVYQQQY